MAEWLAAGAGALGALGSTIGAITANNASNKAIGKQYEYQRELSSTALQRMTADAKKAGINPLYIAGGGGASTPSGGIPNIQNELSGLNELSNAISAYQQLKMNKEQIKATQENTALLKEQAKKEEAMTKQIMQDIKIKDPKEQVSSIATNILSETKNNLNNLGNFWNNLTNKKGIRTTAAKEKDFNTFFNEKLIKKAKDNGLILNNKQIERLEKIKDKEMKLRVIDSLIRANQIKSLRKNRHK